MHEERAWKKTIRLILTFIIGALGDIAFSLLHIPLHWVLGPAAALLAASHLFKEKLYWPTAIRNVGLIPIGYTLGAPVTAATLAEMARQLPTMMLATVLMLLFSFVVSSLVAKWTHLSLRSVVTGCIPGGLSQMLVLGEELKGVDPTVVTLFQVMRLMGVVFLVPLIALSPLLSEGAAGATDAGMAGGPDWTVGLALLYAAVTVAGALVGKRLRLPTAYLLGPIIGTAALVLVGTPAPHLPAPLLDVAQITMGTYLGLMLKPTAIEGKGKVMAASVLAGCALILFSMLSAFVLMSWHRIPYLTAFIALAPGGMDQMGILAQEAHASLAIVTGYQMFRIFFILFVVPPALKTLFSTRWFRRLEQWQTQQHG
ncbi:hypothetical protein M493_07885 [Geobacillus genomosp. 3]|uniref:AbrB family transcriptional regulator n=1 Tax=Geobacillus genomosp. 3 TaxID=1921421 RepID=S5ZN82_GEOG3|nr:AbrB family transcriptional regulator [Geobacillus genomosp. 3]AGT31858.1 hypothetical protein M493_07885 [Geobacillus genomosp. 3]